MHTATIQNSIVRTMRCLAYAAAVAMAVSVGAQAAETLRILTWPGYADPDIVKTFEERTGVKVEVTTIDSDEALWQRVGKNNAEDFDLFAVNTAELQRYIGKEWIVPIDADAIPNRKNQLLRFRQLNEIAGVTRQGKVFAIPYTYSEMGLIYDRKQIPEAPTSIHVLWDPRYRGKVMLYDSGSHNFSLAAQRIGDRTPFDIDSKSWATAVDQLIALRRNALGFYTQPEDSVEWFVSRKAAILFANYGSQQVKLLQAAGVDVGYAIPKEGALAWLDCWVITRGAKNTALAQKWINYMLEPVPGQVLLSRQGLSNTTSESPHLNRKDHLIWLEPVENIERRNDLWTRNMSGDRASKVLAK